MDGPVKIEPVKTEIVSTLDPDQLAVVMNTDKMLLKSMGEICFRRCIINYENENLNPAEQLCIDRCTFKYDSMVRHLVDNSHALRI